jgi:15-cis-phytoene synthase
LRALPVHAARGQIYLPSDLMQRYGAQTADILAGKATTEVRSVLAELRLRARHHLAAVRPLLGEAPSEVLPALLPVALAKPALDRMERRGYEPFQPAELPQWRRQWILWRAARTNLRKAF